MINCRKATISDLDQIYCIYSDQRYDSNDNDSIKYKREDWEWYLEKDQSSTIILIAEKDKEIIGVVFAYDMGIWGYVEHIVMRSDHRRKGYTKILIENLISIGKERGWRIIESCYYTEVLEMKSFFNGISWDDGGIDTRWVFKELF